MCVYCLKIVRPNQHALDSLSCSKLTHKCCSNGININQNPYLRRKRGEIENLFAFKICCKLLSNNTWEGSKRLKSRAERFCVADRSYVGAGRNVVNLNKLQQQLFVCEIQLNYCSSTFTLASILLGCSTSKYDCVLFLRKLGTISAQLVSISKETRHSWSIGRQALEVTVSTLLKLSLKLKRDVLLIRVLSNIYYLLFADIEKMLVRAKLYETLYITHLVPLLTWVRCLHSFSWMLRQLLVMKGWLRMSLVPYICMWHVIK